jgi:hypothetical protein
MADKHKRVRDPRPLHVLCPLCLLELPGYATSS